MYQFTNIWPSHLAHSKRLPVVCGQIMVCGEKRKERQTGAPVRPGIHVQSQFRRLQQITTPMHALPHQRLQKPHTPPTACIVEVFEPGVEQHVCISCAPVAWSSNMAATMHAVRYVPVGDHCPTLYHCKQECWHTAGHAHGKCCCAAGVFRCACKI